MKKKLIILIILIIVFLSGCFQNNVPDRKNLGYTISGNKVLYITYYEKRSMIHSNNPSGPIGLGAFIPSFDFLKLEDDNNGYYTKVLSGADVKTFKILEDGYAKDKNSGYYAGERLSYDDDGIIKKIHFKNFASDSFKVLGNGYAKDKNSGYYMGERFSYYYDDDKRKDIPFKSFLADSFEVLKDGYAKDKNSVYYEGVRLYYYGDNKKKGIPLNKFSVDSFEVLKDGYAKDKNSVYYEGVKLSYYDDDKKKDVPLNSSSSDSFEVLKDGYAKDKYSAYYKGEILSYSYFHNDKYKNIPLKNVSVDSFEVLKNGYAKDKNNVYLGRYQVFYDDFNGNNNNKVSPKNFVILKYGYTKNNEYVFLNGYNTEWDPKSFRIIDKDCILDKNSFQLTIRNDNYYKKYAYDNYDYKTFDRINKTHYFKDKNNVYYKGKILPNIDSSSFKIMYGNFAGSFLKDAFNIYYKYDANYHDNNELKRVTDDVKNFKPYYYIENGSTYKWLSCYYRDSNNVYYICNGSVKKLNTSPKNFELINSSYAKNDKNIYSGWEILNCDYKTFKVRKESFLNPGDAEDKNYYYKYGEIIQKK
jgi:hypothetical protein